MMMMMMMMVLAMAVRGIGCHCHCYCSYLLAQPQRQIRGVVITSAETPAASHNNELEIQTLWGRQDPSSFGSDSTRPAYHCHRRSRKTTDDAIDSWITCIMTHICIQRRKQKPRVQGEASISPVGHKSLVGCGGRREKLKNQSHTSPKPQIPDTIKV